MGYATGDNRSPQMTKCAQGHQHGSPNAARLCNKKTQRIIARSKEVEHLKKYGSGTPQGFNG